MSQQTASGSRAGPSAGCSRKAKLPAFRLYDLRHTFAGPLLAAGAPITYVSAQLDIATPTTTLRFDAKWIPSKGRRWEEVLDGAELRSEANFGTRIWNGSGPATPVVAQALEKLGEPSGTRTRDPRIKRLIRSPEAARICGPRVCGSVHIAARSATQPQPVWGRLSLRRLRPDSSLGRQSRPLRAVSLDATVLRRRRRRFRE